MKDINSARKFAKYLFVAGLAILTTFSIAQAQRRGGGGFHGGGGGGGRSFGGGYHGNFGGGNRIVYAPRYSPGRINGGFRGNLNIGIGRGYGYRGGYYGRPSYGRGFFYRGYGGYNRGYFPHIGFYLNVLPYGYYPFNYSGYPYYYNQGLFYQQYNDGYQIVAPPMGAEVPNLPRGAQQIAINGNQYFEYQGVYYEPVTDDNGKMVYVVAGKDGVLNTDDGQQQYSAPQNNQAPADNGNNYNKALPQVGDVANSLPAHSRRVKINGEVVYVSPDGVYYQKDTTGNTRIFRVVGVPAEDGTAEADSN